MKSIVVDQTWDGRRLTRFLQKAMPAASAGQVARFLRLGRVKVDGKRGKEDTVLAAGQQVEMYVEDEWFAAPEREDPFYSKIRPKLTILYEDEQVMLLDKRPGLVCHPDEGEKVHTLLTYAQAYLYQKGEWKPEEEASFTPALCNRIDRNTGGIVIAAKTAEALRDMNEIIRIRDIDKYYLCLVHGIPNEKGTLKGYLKKMEDENRVIVRDKPFEGAKTAITEYRRLATKNGLSLCECHLITGRTHQIRAQMAHAGFPLFGDGKYGTERSRRKHQALFSYKLVFTLSNYDGVLSYLKGKVFTVNNVDFAGEYFPDMKY